MRAHPDRALAVALLLVGVYLFTQLSASTPAAAPRLAALPLEMAPWSGAEAPPLDPEIAEVLAADAYVHRVYASPAGQVEMDLSYYARPRVGSNMHSPLNCLPGTGWQIAAVRTRLAGGAWPVRDLLVRRASSSYALTYWYQNRERVDAGEFSARFHLLADALRGRGTDAGLVRAMMPAVGDGRAERDVLLAFAGRIIPEVASRLR